MGADSAEPCDRSRVCPRPSHCPVCAAPNCCRLETGEAYKGACWCERLTLSGPALRRLAAELPEPRCLCQDCLEVIARNPEVTWDELAARTVAREAGIRQ